MLHFKRATAGWTGVRSRTFHMFLTRQRVIQRKQWWKDPRNFTGCLTSVERSAPSARSPSPERSSTTSSSLQAGVPLETGPAESGTWTPVEFFLCLFAVDRHCAQWSSHGALDVCGRVRSRDETSDQTDRGGGGGGQLPSEDGGQVGERLG